jgi:hypothetical protein
MTAQRDPERLIRAFLDEGPTDLPDRAFDAVRAHIDRTRQRTVLGSWRNPPMPTFFRFAPIAVAIALVAVVGTLVITGRPNLPSSPAPSATNQPVQPTFVPSTALAYRWPQALVAGDYATSFAWDLPFAVAFTLPAGWESRDIEIVKGDMSIAVALPWDLFDDPCATTPKVLDAGSTPEDFARALATNASLTVGEQSHVNLGGVTATALTYRARAGVECVGEGSKLWSSPEWLILPVTPLGTPWWPLRAGLHRLWVLDVDGQRLVLDATTGANPTPAKEAELQEVLDSLRFVAPVERRSLGTCQVALTSPAAGAPVIPPGPVTMSDRHDPILAGVLPVGFIEPPISAHLDYRVSDVTGSGPESMRPRVGVVADAGSGKDGLATLLAESSTVPGSRDLLGTFLLDAPGTWWLRVSIPYAGCVYQQPIVVAGPG